ncbi:MAG: glutathione peroxidase [Bacteroidota bacterium]
MKTISFFFSILLFVSFASAQKKSFYDFKAINIDGKEIDLSQYKGKKVLVINVASECSYTPQYKEMEWLYKNYKDSGLVIIVFPCNDFNGYEPGDNQKIKTFCQKKYGITFFIMSKIIIKGNDCHPLYKWLQNKEENGVKDAKVLWNFNKFMINEDGTWGGYLPSEIKPNNRIITDWIMDR